MNQALLSSAKHDWRTPPEILDLVRQLGPIRLDPCTTLDNPVGALFFSTAETDGLSVSWQRIGDNPIGSGLVYVNPPYGRALKPWSQKIWQEGSLRRHEIIALVPARTDTGWWQNYIAKGRVICFWTGRITFWAKHPETGEYGPAVIWSKKTQRWQKAPAPFPSALVYWGPRADRFAEVFGPHGWIVRP